jgi:hypothetical protein
MILLAKRSGNWHQVEVYEFEPINLSYQFTSVENINEPASNFSQRFRVPLTEQNQKVFGPFDWSQVPAFDLKEKTDARILLDGVVLFEGFLQVENWYIQKGQYVDIELIFMGESANLSRAIGDGLIGDLDFSALNFEVKEDNLKDSWDDGLFDGAVRTGIVDKGWAWDDSNFPFFSQRSIKQYQITPFVSVKRILDEIMSVAGLTYESQFFDAMTELFLCCNKGGLLLPTTDDFRNETFHVGRLTDITVAGGGYTAVALSETGVFSDNGANWVTDTFTAPFTGVYYFRIYYSYTLTNLADTLSVRLDFSAGADYTTSSPFGYAFHTREMAAGDTVQLKVSTTNGVTLHAGGAFRGGTSLQLYAFTVDSGFDVDIAKCMPTMKKIDFVSGLQKMFNLVFIPDRNRTNHFYIEPFADYFATGTVKDWSNKIDISKDITVSTTAELQKRKYIFTYSASTDIANSTAVQEGEVYGSRIINDPENDFASGELKVESPFSPFITWTIEGTDVSIARLYNEGAAPTDREIPDPKPMLAFWNRLLQNTFFMDNNSGTATEYDLPGWSEFSTWFPDVDDESLHFGHPRPRREILATPLNGLYYKYWLPWASELYSSDARILRAFFYLDSVDLSTFEWNDKIFLKNTYWRVLEINNYDPTTPGAVEVKLVKVLGRPSDCDTLPDTGKGGIIQYTPTSATKECCEKYGYEYEKTGKCYQPLPI